jgi:trehalose/maltose hydrolase-like predicted phosphorylase
VYFIHFPEVAKSVLMYRYRRLEEAKKYAKEFGYQGAMYPWQSGSTGKEETQKYHFNPVSGHWGDDHSSLQRHVSLAIAYNILQYFHFTKDGEFMEKFGAEMLLEICRFWASKTEFDEKTGHYSITKVMGPDEFHEGYPESEEGGLTDNAYTNIMSVWMFDESFKYLNSLTENERKLILLKIDLKEEELVFWNKISEKLKLIISPESIIAQYDGYFDLNELDFNFYKEKYGNVYRMDRLLKAEGKSPDDYKVAKQADMLMVFYNLNKERVNEILRKLNYQVSEDYVKKNLEYYLQRTSHGSTLSRVVHCYLANLIDDERLSWELFSDAITSDYNDIQGGTTAEGIHSGVMAGTIWITLTAYAGLDLSGETPKVNPKLPKHWRSLKFNFHFQGKHYFCEIEEGKADLVIG